MTSTATAAVVPPSTGVRYQNHAAPLWRRLLFRSETILLAALVVVILVSSAFVPNFAEPFTYSSMLLNIAPILLLVLPVTLIVVTGEIDLSVGSVLGLSSAVFGLATQAGLPVGVGATLGVLAGTAVGLLNGVLVTVVGLPSIAVTIGTLSLFRGVAVGMLGTTSITTFSPSLTDAANALVGSSPIPVAVVGIGILAVLFGYLLHFTPFGRGLYAIGLSPEMASFSGVRSNRSKCVLFVMSGFVAGLAGIYYTLQYDNAIGSNGYGMELQVVTGIILGGVSFWGGRGTLVGALIGSVLIGVLAKALQLGGIGSDGTNVVTGVVLILSVGIGSLARIRTRRRRPKTSEAA
ncbi:ABC transporter permease [Luteimicrobium xylanilyticum]|uniref:Autoinducer 2 import system permease protein LsrD n=1 Tax=Luteimicrobium xylanilyticum TaxID=1133546 RepID=A0A5P9Q6X6_9MICO|nr:ABC transporter permease [Luteimicrobium xylanilyticum]QFU97164.1 Ribose transport system permease protein [Luteimicrobium xylanilyticum]